MDSLRRIPPQRAQRGKEKPKPRRFALPPKESLPYPPEIPAPKSEPSKRSVSRFFRVAFLSLFFAFLGVALLAGLFIVFKGFSIGKKISVVNDNAPSLLSQIKSLTTTWLTDTRVPLRGEEGGRINILLLGRAGEHYPGRNLTDTVMVMSIDTETKKVALLSLPRDLYVPIADTALYTKLNSVYQYGLGNQDGPETIRGTIEEVTGLPLHYFAILDFDGFEQAVDAIGGISVDVVRDFYDPRYPGKNYSYETFEIKKGWQELDGKTALKYVRERHNDPEGDFGRAKRQQQVIQAIKEKAFSTGTFLNVFALNRLLDTLGENVMTDMTLDEMQSFLELTKTLDTRNVTSFVVDAWKRDSLLRVSHLELGGVRAFILVPRTGNWSEIHDVAQSIFSLDELKKRRERIASEEPSLLVLASPDALAAAQKFARLAKDERGFQETAVRTVKALAETPEKSIIRDDTGLGKPYSLDELLKKFPLEKSDTLPYDVPAGIHPDFVVVFGQDLRDALDFDETASDETVLQNDNDFSEPLTPQEKKKR